MSSRDLAEEIMEEQGCCGRTEIREARHQVVGRRRHYSQGEHQTRLLGLDTFKLIFSNI